MAQLEQKSALQDYKILVVFWKARYTDVLRMVDNHWNRADIFGKKGDVAVCQLCNQLTKMSQAHVPSQACIEEERRDKVAARYFGNGKCYRLQNGLHFYTLCEGCNSLLGSKYGAEIANFSKTLRNFAVTPLIIPKQWKGIECKPNRIARSLIGSYLTAGGEHIEESLRNILQHYVLNEETLLPAAIKIAFWIHPFDSVMVTPDCLMIDSQENDFIKINLLMKYFPLGWMIYSSDAESMAVCQHYKIHNFSSYLSEEIDELCTVEIVSEMEKAEYWPDVSDQMAILIGQNAEEHAAHAYTTNPN